MALASNLNNEPLVSIIVNCFNGEKYLFEANIFNFSDNLYGQRLEFDIISKIRGTKKFNGIDELKQSIKNDIAKAKEIFKIK